MATTNANHSMNLLSMENQSMPFHPGNSPVLMFVAGLSCMIAGIVKLVQNQEEISGNAIVYEIARRSMIGLSFTTAGLFLILKACQLVELPDIIGITFIMIFLIMVVNFIHIYGIQNLKIFNGTTAVKAFLKIFLVFRTFHL